MISDGDFTANRDAADKTIPEFFLQAEKNNFKSEEAGREIFEDREFVRIITPGMMRSIPVEPVNPEHIHRWPRQYDAFKRGLDPVTEGTPLDQVAFLSPSVVRTLQAMNIKTVEALAGVTDGVLSDLPLGGRDLRTKAQAFLDSAVGNALVERERARADRAEEDVGRLEAQVSDLAGRLQALESAKTKTKEPA